MLNVLSRTEPITGYPELEQELDEDIWEFIRRGIIAYDARNGSISYCAYIITISGACRDMPLAHIA